MKQHTKNSDVTYRSKNRKMLLINQVQHVGGGQRYTNLINKALQSLQISCDYLENGLDFSGLRRLWKGHHSYIISNYFVRPKNIQIIIHFFALLMGKKQITIAYGLWFLESKSRYPNQNHLRTFRDYIMQALLFVTCRKIVVLSKYEKTLLKKYFPWIPGSKVYIIEPYSDIDAQRSLKRGKAFFRTKLNLPEDKLIFMTASRIEKRKGIDVAIRAFKKVCSDRPDSMLIVVFPAGISNQHEYIWDIIRLIEDLKMDDSIRLIGGVGFDRIHNYYLAADMFLMSSTELETFGITTVEALSCGCPVVGFNTGATPEILNHIGSELIAPELTYGVYARTILKNINLSDDKKRNLRSKCLSIKNIYNSNIFNNKFNRLFE